MNTPDVKEAVELILNSITPIRDTNTIYIDIATGRVVSKDIRSNTSMPAFTRSSMDGYALIGEHEEYTIVKSESELKEGTCIRINTGFPVPEDAYAVVEVEKATVQGNKLILKERIEKQRNFTLKGSELKKGELLVHRCEILSTKLVSLLAYAGIFTLEVYRKPLIGIITTGDEVIFPSCNPPEGSVFNSNYFIVSGLCKKWLSETVYFGHIKDDVKLFKEKLTEAIDRCDFVVTTGGVSKGTRDYTREVLRNIGAELLFSKTTIKPGKPAVFALFKDKYIMSLPGWPAALYTTALIYLKPALLKLSGANRFRNEMFIGVLDEDMHSRYGKDYFNRVKVEYKNGEYHLKSAGSQKTDNFYSVAIADALVWLNKEIGDAPKGSRHPFIFLD